MKIHIITYATHSEGSFQKLLGNEYNIVVNVVGWGKPWNGFMDKFNGIYKHIEKYSDDDIIVFVDGFDSKINKSLDEIKQAFLDFDANIVLSTHPDLINKYANEKSFGTCYDDIVANSGLYAGYNKNIKQLLKYIIEENHSTDDQRALNHACKHFINDIKLDKDGLLFLNQDYKQRNSKKENTACIISTPGVLTWNRIKRLPKEYLPFFLKEFSMIIFFIIIILGCFYYYYKNYLKFDLINYKYINQ
jgi:hypothetical protein